MKFIPEYPISELEPADYNPRIISSDSFQKLIESIEKFGMVKPVILNGNGKLTAGHQRIKACKTLDKQTTPAILLNNISLHDEIRFNLFHNSIETNKSYAKIEIPENVPFGYSYVDFEAFSFGPNLNAPVTKHIADLYLKYGNWGSVIVHENGKVILNSDYAITMAMFKEKILVYKMRENEITEFCKYINLDFGEYHYSALKIKPYVQFHCQLNRVKSDEREGLRSTLYEKIVMKQLSQTQRIVDFGAGKFVYVDFLRSKGFDISGYEPYYKKNNHQILISKVIADIQKLNRKINSGGLFDVVVLDSVLNSITSLDYEHAVLVCCNALMNQNGVLYLATRCLESVQEKSRQTKSTQKPRVLEFLDKNNFSATFRQGNWTLQRFHTFESLKKLLLIYFKDVTVKPGKSQNYAICKNPKVLDEAVYKEAFEAEFNLEYPNDYKHSSHTELVTTLFNHVKLRNSTAKNAEN